MSRPTHCERCGTSLAGDDDSEYFDEPDYRVQLLPSPTVRQRPLGGRPYLITCPGCSRKR